MSSSELENGLSSVQRIRGENQPFSQGQADRRAEGVPALLLVVADTEAESNEGPDARRRFPQKDLCGGSPLL